LSRGIFRDKPMKCLLSLIVTTAEAVPNLVRGEYHNPDVRYASVLS